MKLLLNRQEMEGIAYKELLEIKNFLNEYADEIIIIDNEGDRAI